MSLADHHNHFLDLADLPDGQLRHLLDAAAARKAARAPFRNKYIVQILGKKWRRFAPTPSLIGFYKTIKRIFWVPREPPE